MKTLNFEQMESLKAGYSCFFAIPVLSVATGGPFVLGPIGAIVSRFTTKAPLERVVECWNS